MPALSLPDGKLLHTQGWSSSGSTAKFRVELADDQMLRVYRQGWAGEKPLAWIPPQMLWLGVGSQTVRSGGGFFGGGFGMQGAAEGMLEASVLNALTTRHREYTLLTVGATEANGTERTMVFGYRNIDESTLRDQLGQAIPNWVEPFVKNVLKLIASGESSESELDATHGEVATMVARGILTKDQAARLEHALPLRIQAEEPPPPRPEAATSTVSELQRLADLHQHGALTDAEFQTAKARILE